MRTHNLPSSHCLHHYPSIHLKLVELLLPLLSLLFLLLQQPLPLVNLNLKSHGEMIVILWEKATILLSMSQYITQMAIGWSSHHLLFGCLHLQKGISGKLGGLPNYEMEKVSSTCNFSRNFMMVVCQGRMEVRTAINTKESSSTAKCMGEERWQCRMVSILPSIGLEFTCFWRRCVRRRIPTKFLSRKGNIHSSRRELLSRFETHIQSHDSLLLFSNISQIAFKGLFASGVPQGRGTGRLANGDEYEGDVSRNTFNGHGKYRYHNGDVLTCGFQDGRPQGAGEYLVANEGASRRGVWNLGTSFAISFLKFLPFNSFFLLKRRDSRVSMMFMAIFLNVFLLPCVPHPSSIQRSTSK